MQRLIISSLLAASMLALGLGEASAADRKVKAGSECVRWRGATPVLSYSALHNPSPTSDVRVDCPVTRDVAANNGIRLARVRVLDKHPFDRVSCQLVSTYRNRFGQMIDRAGPVDFSWNGRDTLAFDTTSGPSSCSGNICTRDLVTRPAAPYEDSYSHAYLSCRIPPAYRGQTSAIDAYLVDENY
jgi:hypothetical protein